MKSGRPPPGESRKPKILKPRKKRTVRKPSTPKGNSKNSYRDYNTEKGINQ